MNNVFRRSLPFLMATVFGTGVIAVGGIANAQTQTDPPARVGRLAFASGTVSFHDSQDANWTAAAVNDTLTTGDSLWTEPNARSEVSVAGTRVRLDQSTQLDMLQIDDSETRLQLDQGRLDIKTFTMDTAQPYEIVTPRGTVKLAAQGDYYIESGSTQDPTRLGVRSGAAQITGLNGQVLAVRAGEVGEITGDAASPQLHTIQTAPPPMPQYWAQRDQQIAYTAPQYISADVVGYEDMQAYGAWSNDPDYGAGMVAEFGVGELAALQHRLVGLFGALWLELGRRAAVGLRALPLRPLGQPQQPLVLGAAGAAASTRSMRRRWSPSSAAPNWAWRSATPIAAPIGWFPLGPREAYVPPYTHDRAYYDRINTNARVERAVLDDRWQRAERHEAITANAPNEQMVNRRFTTVVPASAFISSQHVERAAIKVSADKLAAAPVAPVSAPPAPAQGNVPKARYALQWRAGARPPDRRPAPGAAPRSAGAEVRGAHFADGSGDRPGNDSGRQARPAAARAASRCGAAGDPGRAHAGAAAERGAARQAGRAQSSGRGQPGRTAEAGRSRPCRRASRPIVRNRRSPASRPRGSRPCRIRPKPSVLPTTATRRCRRRIRPKRRSTPGTPQTTAPQAQHQAAEPAKPAEAPHAATPQPPHQAEAPHAPAPQPPHQAEAPHVAPPQAQHVESQHAAEPPRAPAAAPQPQHVQAPPAPPVQHAPPQQAQAPAPHPAAPPPQAPHPAAQPAPAPHPAAPAASLPRRKRRSSPGLKNLIAQNLVAFP